MPSKIKKRPGTFEENLGKLQEQLEREKEALNKILRSMEDNNYKETTIKKNKQ